MLDDGGVVWLAACPKDRIHQSDDYSGCIVWVCTCFKTARQQREACWRKLDMYVRSKQAQK